MSECGCSGCRRRRRVVEHRERHVEDLRRVLAKALEALDEARRLPCTLAQREEKTS